MGTDVDNEEIKNSPLAQGRTVAEACRLACDNCPGTAATVDPAGTTVDPATTADPETTQAETEEPETTKAATQAQVEDKRVVKFNMDMNIKRDEFDANKDKITEKIADQVGQPKEKVTVTVVSRRNRRMLQDSVKLEVTVKAADDTAADAIKTRVASSTFAADLAKAVNESTNLNVEITGVTAPVSENLTTTTTTDDDDNNTTMIIIIVVAIVAVLAIGGFVCYTMNNNDKMAKEVGGGEVEFEKRTPGTQA